MTDLNKPITRRASATYFDRGTRRILVTLIPARGSRAERISFRLERTRQAYTVDLAGLFEVVLQRSIESDRRAIDRRAKELVKAGHNKRTAKKLARQERKQSTER